MSDQQSAYDRLSPGVQRWVYHQQWKNLREIQLQAIPAVLSGSDVIIAAGTASGKTEAAFLPVLSAIESSSLDHLKAIYVAPLKALINDQERRLIDMCAHIGAKVTPWHGDVAASRKSSLFKAPSGLLLITPESLEALFINRGSGVGAFFAEVDFIVIDELHAFIGTERGRQLQSLLHRIERIVDRRIPRIALSATLGDLKMAAEFLRPSAGQAVRTIESNVSNRETRLQIRGYEEIEPEPLNEVGELVCDVQLDFAGGFFEIAEHVFKTTYESTNIVFANRKADVERLSDLLRRTSEEKKLPNRHLPHHGGLSKEIRFDAEAALQSDKPTTVIATTTLEMGIDFGKVESVGQIGPPPSVASLKQRLGRSGRQQGDPAIIRIYVSEPRPPANAALTEQLHMELVQAIAMVRLMLLKWIEPPRPSALHLSTLIQQALSQIAQTGGIDAGEAHRTLCSTGPFRQVSPSLFAELLRDLAKHDLITQLADGTLVLGLTGERLVNQFDFYAAFSTPEEWRLITGGTVLGSLPTDDPLKVGEFLIFAGRRWKIVAIDDERHDVELLPHKGGRLPRYSGAGPGIHERVMQEMLAVFQGDQTPPFVDATSARLLVEARAAFAKLGLATRRIVSDGRDVLVYAWTGTEAMTTLALLLSSRGIETASGRYHLVVSNRTEDQVARAFAELAESGPHDPVTLLTGARNLATEKHHRYLRPELLALDVASSRIDLPGAMRAIDRMVGRA